MITLQPQIVILAMIFFHVIDDYTLQGILASMKQKSWWEKQPGYESMYSHDYIPALLVHGFSWSFMIHIPIFIYYGFQLPYPNFFLVIIILQGILHSSIDHMKANDKVINLIQDQIIHLMQILVSFITIFFV